MGLLVVTVDIKVPALTQSVEEQVVLVCVRSAILQLPELGI